MENVKEKKFVVYKHTNIENGKVYIGITSKIPSYRWLNGSGYRTQRLFWRAIKKYGWSSFESEILFENLNKEDACSKEIELIEFYKSNNPKFGYNISSGGESGASGIVHTQESRDKNRKAHLGFKHTEETKIKIGQNGWTKKNKGNIVFSEEHKQKMRKAKQKIARAIICIETGEIFQSICECARQLNLSKRNIGHVLKGRRKTYHKLHFKYYNGDKK